MPRPLNRIVGIVKDTKYTDLREAFTPIGFYASSQEEKPNNFLSLVVRSSAPLATTTAQVSAAAMQINPSISLQFDTMKTQVRESLLRERLMATLSAFFGGLAVIIATIGLYGVMSYTVARRRVEIGVRMALGADRARVVGMIVREAALLLVAGVIAGTVLGIAAGRWASTLLYDLKPWDPLTIGLAVVALGAATLLASWLPARRASRLEPTVALREE